MVRERKWGLKDGGVLCAEGMELEYFGLDYEGLGKRWLEDDREMVMEEKREINKMRDGCFMGEGKVVASNAVTKFVNKQRRRHFLTWMCREQSAPEEASTKYERHVLRLLFFRTWQTLSGSRMLLYRLG